MRESKALAIQALLLTGAVVRIEIRKAGQSDPDMWWLGHLDSIAELLLPSVEAGQPSPAGEGAQETPSLLTYLTTNDPAQRDAAFLQTYAARLRDGTAQSWEIPNTVASTIEDIAQRLVNHTLPPERSERT